MQFTDLVPLVEAKQALLFINQHRENAFRWVAASGIEDGASTDLRFPSGEVTEFADNIAWTQYISHSLEKSHDIFCWGGFCCCLCSGDFCWLVVPPTPFFWYLIL